ncbi:MAG: sugar kinase [Halolamina sp.]
MTDLVAFGEATLRLRAERGRRLEDTDTFAAGVGGPERNVVVTAARLGADAVWLSRLPATPLGERVVADLRGHGVRTGISWADSNARLATAFVESGPTPRGRTTVTDSAGAAFESVDAANLPVNAVQSAGRFHVTGVTPARSERAAAATETLLDAASEGDTVTSVDLQYEATGWDAETARTAAETLFPHVDVLFVSLAAAADVLETDGDPVDIAYTLRTENEFETVVLLREDGGALAVHGEEVYETDAVDGDPIDDAGARDAFIGAFHAERIRGGDTGAALTHGAAAAALASTLEGDSVSVSREEVDRLAGAGG